jgi:hypothetical protein
LSLPKEDSSLLGYEKTNFSSTYEMCLFEFLFLGESGTCPQNLMPTRRVEPWENHQFPQGYAEIHIQRPFFDNKNNIWKILGLKIQTVETCSSASSTCRNFYFWKNTKISFFGGIPKFRLWAVLGKFCCIDNITFFKRGPTNPYQQCKTTSKIHNHVGFSRSLNWSLVEETSFHLLWPIL